MVSKKNETKTTQFPIQADVNKVLTNTKSSIKFTDLEILEGVRNFPVRIKCSLLSWSTLEDSLS